VSNIYQYPAKVNMSEHKRHIIL